MGVQTVVEPLKNEFVGGVRTRLWLVMATAGLLLLLTWTNATNLALVHAETQRRDVAVERALGATGRHVAIRWLAEAVLLGGLAGVVGTAIAAAAINAHFGFQADQLPRLSEVRVDAATVSFVAILTVISAILLGAVGMLSAQRRARAGTLTAGLVRTTAGRTEQRGRRVLVGVQISVAMTLLVASGLMTRSFWRLLHARLGFEPAGVYTLFLPTSALGYSEYADHARFHGVIVERLRATPGIKEVEVATRGTFPVAPTAWHNHQRMIPTTASLADSAKAPAPLFGFATPGYFHTMGIPVLAGRVFTTDDARPATPGVILSAALARAAFGTQSPVGQQVRFEASGPQTFTVVGVVGDVPSEGIAKGPSEILYFPTIVTPPIDPVTKKGLNVGSFAPNQEVYVVKTTLPPASILTAVRGALRDVAPQLVVVDPRALDDLVADSIADTRLTMLLLLVAAAAAMIVGLVGIYGIQAYAVTQRTSELGVRIALGADPGDVITMVVREAALVTALGVAGGLAMATAIGRLMTTLLYGISATDPGVFVAMAALFVVVALMASYIPTRRIATIDLVRALSGG
jgi:predicted permease